MTSTATHGVVVSASAWCVSVSMASPPRMMLPRLTWDASHP